jgi:hypothetical protein
MLGQDARLGHFRPIFEFDHLADKPFFGFRFGIVCASVPLAAVHKLHTPNAVAIDCLRDFHVGVIWV